MPARTSCPRSRSCSTPSRRRTPSWSSPARSRRGRSCVARVERRRARWRSPATCPTRRRAARIVADIARRARAAPVARRGAAIGAATGGDRGDRPAGDRQARAVRRRRRPTCRRVPIRRGRARSAPTVADADLAALVDGVAGGEPIATGRQLAEFDAGAVPRHHPAPRRHSPVLAAARPARRGRRRGECRARGRGGAAAVFCKEREPSPPARRAGARPRSAARSPACSMPSARSSGAARAGDVAVGQLLLALATQAQG